MTPNDRIVSAAYAVLRGDNPNMEPRNAAGTVIGGMCLAQVRLIVERALYGGRYAWYAAQRVIRVQEAERASADPYARDMEASLRHLGLTLDLPRRAYGGDPTRFVDLFETTRRNLLLPGDLLFRWDVVPDANGVLIGHVAVLLPGSLVLENVTTRPGAMKRGATTVSRLGAWPVTSVARLTMPT